MPPNLCTGMAATYGVQRRTRKRTTSRPSDSLERSRRVNGFHLRQQVRPPQRHTQRGRRVGIDLQAIHRSKVVRRQTVPRITGRRHGLSNCRLAITINDPLTVSRISQRPHLVPRVQDDRSSRIRRRQPAALGSLKRHTGRRHVRYSVGDRPPPPPTARPTAAFHHPGCC